jgi:hypothetical protein
MLILFSHLRLYFSSGLFPSGFHTKIVYAFLFSSIRATCPADHDFYSLFVSARCNLMMIFYVVIVVVIIIIIIISCDMIYDIILSTTNIVWMMA